MKVLAVLLGLVVVAGGVALAVWLSGVLEGPVESGDLVWAIITGAFLVIPGFYLILFVGHRRLTDYLLGRVRWSLEPREIRTGEELRVEVSIEPRFSRRIGGAYVTVRAVESEIHPAGGFTWREKHLRFRKTKALARPMVIHPGDVQRWSRTIQIPRGSPLTMRSLDSIRWTVEARVSMPWWPDWRREKEITVYAGPGAGD